jgi:hypothetical protein
LENSNTDKISKTPTNTERIRFMKSKKLNSEHFTWEKLV